MNLKEQKKKKIWKMFDARSSNGCELVWLRAYIDWMSKRERNVSSSKLRECVAKFTHYFIIHFRIMYTKVKPKTMFGTEKKQFENNFIRNTYQ